MQLLSIIIPTYNMDAFLGRCLDSLLIGEQQNFLDVIVVNDGSKDKSSEIAHCYADRYPDSFRVIDKTNGNYGSCINAALPTIQGKYVRILDADDYYDTSCLKVFLQKLADTDADAVLSPNNFVFPNRIEKSREQKSLKDGQSFETSTDDVPPFFMHQVAYRSEIFRSHQYTQTEGISYTDQEWICYPLQWVKTIEYYNIPLYQYCIGRDGQTMDLNVYCKRLNQVQRIINRMVENFPEFEKCSMQLCKYLKQIPFNLTVTFYEMQLLHLETVDIDLMNEVEEVWKKFDEKSFNKFSDLIVDKLVPVHHIKHWREQKKGYSKFYRFILKKWLEIARTRRIIFSLFGI